MAGWAAFLIILGGFSASISAGLERPRGNLDIHDPSTIVFCDGRYYVFGTGQGIISKSSPDLLEWTAGPSVFPFSPPSWTTTTVPGFGGIFWAPDLIFLNDQYYLYYSVSLWGSNRSAIGLATNPTLNPADPRYFWHDQGLVIASYGTNFNAIDPSVMRDNDGTLWMSFGSFWSGIRLVQL